MGDHRVRRRRGPRRGGRSGLALTADGPPFTVCTIVARNYLAHARVLARSVAEHHPGTRVAVLLVDGDAPAGFDDLDVVRPTEAGFTAEEFADLAGLYRLVELATAVKPRFLRHLLDATGAPVLYLDPDIVVFRPLTAVVEATAAHGVVLTPHLTEPVPRFDDLTAGEDIVLSVGVHNLGFAGVSPAAGPFLDWWDDSLRRECVIDPRNQRFVDQRWMDLAPGYFGAHLLRDPGLNVAWWNLPTRRVTPAPDGGLAVNGRPLVFFHFSGYDPDTPHLLTRHQGPGMRVILSERPDLRPLCDDYGRRLRDAGFAAVQGIPYALDRMADGTAIDDRMRGVFRDALLAHERRGAARPPGPLAADGGAAFRTWLTTPEDRGASTAAVGRYLERLWRDRPDLAARFPDIVRDDAEAFASWARGPEGAAAGVPPDLAVARPPRDPGAGGPGAEGVNVCGYLRAELGVGEAARQVLAGVRAAGIPHATVVHDQTASRQAHAGEADGEPRYDVNVICVNADQLIPFLHQVGPGLREGRSNVGMCWWELAEVPPAFGDALAFLDEVWVGSAFVAEALRTVTDRPVTVVPLPVEVPEPAPRTRAELGMPDGYCFLFSFDWFSVMERKNPFGVIEAFTRAFRPGEGPALVVKSINGDHHREGMERLRDAAADRPDIVVIDGYLTAPDRAAMTALCDCYVSLHRSEGFGLTVAEAMALGRPVIATGYSGTTEFLTSATGYPVAFAMTRVPEGCAPYRPGAEWADPDLDDAARLMRQVAADPAAAAEVGERARDHMRSRHSAAALAAELPGLLDAARGRRRARDDARAQAAADALSAAAPTWAGDARLGAVGRFARRALFRALKPYTDAQGRGIAAGFGRVDALSAALGAATAGSEVLTDRVRALEERTDRLEGGLTPWPYVSDPRLVRETGPDGRERLGFRGGAGDSDLYRGFEEVFRGGEALVRERQARYLRLVGDRAPIADLGCGRGEFLDLAASAGREAVGVDLDEGMVARCRAKGHAVDHGDIVDWLAARPDGSLGAVFTAQVVEHVPYPRLCELLRLAPRKLAPGGVLIAETVNPHALFAFKTFFVDPTHEHPLFPEVLLTLARLSGFSSGHIVFPQGTGDLEADRLGTGEYALVAYAPETPGPEVRAPG